MGSPIFSALALLFSFTAGRHHHPACATYPAMPSHPSCLPLSLLLQSPLLGYQ
ncbi:hypothetical protein SEVIR_3G410201v4 [Setaria viridis]